MLTFFSAGDHQMAGGWGQPSTYISIYIYTSIHIKMLSLIKQDSFP